LFVITSLAGCGFTVPSIQEGWQGPDGTKQLEFEIKRSVYCALRSAIQLADKSVTYYGIDPKTGQYVVEPFLPDNWGVQISLLIQVDEVTAFNPGIGVTEPFSNVVTVFNNGNVTTPRSFFFGLGATVSATSTRIDKFNPYYTVEYLRRKETPQSTCIEQNDPFRKDHVSISTSSLLIANDLKAEIDRWLHDAMFTTRALPSYDPSNAMSNGQVPDTVSIDIKFVVVTSGNVNPIWRLMPVAFNNNNNPLLQGGRTRTHDLLITIGVPSIKTDNANLASQFGQAVSSAFSSTPTTSSVP
jgi:hypothetical protein